MDITPVIPYNFNVINGYGSQGFVINEITYKNTIILSKNQLLEVKVKSIEEIFDQNLIEIFNCKPEIILLGIGKSHIIAPEELKNKIKIQYKHASINEMNIGAACRTYNVLIGESRDVMLILLNIF